MVIEIQSITDCEVNIQAKGVRVHNVEIFLVPGSQPFKYKKCAFLAVFWRSVISECTISASRTAHIISVKWACLQ